MVALYSATLFQCSATLSGAADVRAPRASSARGSPSGWNTAMVFHQTMLLAGYAYAHQRTAPSAWCDMRAGTCSSVPLALLPIGIPPSWTPPASSVACSAPSLPPSCFGPAPNPKASLRVEVTWSVLHDRLILGLLAAASTARRRPDPTLAGLIVGPPALVCYFFSRRPLRFSLGLGAMLLARNLFAGEKGRVLSTARSFFGAHCMTHDSTENFHRRVHRKTLHGMQNLDSEHRRQPLPYDHRSGPIGLGAASLANYALL